MIIIAGSLDFDPGQREEALSASADLVLATRQQVGCLDYVWSPDPVVPGRVYVFERWEDEGALKAHFEGSNYWDMRKALGQYGKLKTDIWKYRPDCIERVYDKEGTPRADFFTEKGE